MMKFYIETLGCALNRGDSNLMKMLLMREGFNPTENPNIADIIIVNTCAVRADSEQKSLKLISKLKSENPKAKLVVAGCLTEINPYAILRQAPEAILISPYRILEVTAALSGGEKIRLGLSNSKKNLVPSILDGVIGIVPINDGCLGNCSFCVTKHARRALLSRPPSVIIPAVRNLVEAGAKEIQLASQDAGVYGIDISGRKILPELLGEINNEVQGKYMLRVAMMNPDTLRDILWKLIEAYRLEHIYKFAHIPLQSGDDEVLKLMNRNYTVKEYLDIIRTLKKEIPNITIATDIMVGHPGEDEQAFEKTLEVIKTGLIDRIHIAQYTPRPFTISARLEQISDGVKKARSRKLLDLHSSISSEKMNSYVGKKIRGFIVEASEKRKSLTVRTENYLSIVVKNSGEWKLGDEVIVKVTGATFFDLRGEILEKVT